jgi:hypothetical protein
MNSTHAMHVLTLHVTVGVFQSIKRIWLTRIQFLTFAGIFCFTTKPRLAPKPAHLGSQWKAVTVLNALNLLAHDTVH